MYVPTNYNSLSFIGSSLLQNTGRNLADLIE